MVFAGMNRAYKNSLIVLLLRTITMTGNMNNRKNVRLSNFT